jgi:nitroimidazol reductase NimA-like FMN-containing flavoprotein (pyridoxamine 5'-phosphate oxidase superfamily)
MWVDDRFYFDGAPKTRWARNLETNPAISVHIEQGAMVAIVEGQAERMSLGRS